MPQIRDSKLDQEVDKLQNNLHAGREAASEMIERLSARAGDTLRQGADLWHDQSNRVREQASYVSDRTAGYVRNEPIKAVLIAAATGAVIFAVASLFGRSSSLRRRFD